MELKIFRAIVLKYLLCKGFINGEDFPSTNHERMLQRLSAVGRIDNDYLNKLPPVFDDLERTHATALSLLYSSPSTLPLSSTIGSRSSDLAPGQATPVIQTPKPVHIVEFDRQKQPSSVQRRKTKHGSSSRKQARKTRESKKEKGSYCGRSSSLLARSNMREAEGIDRALEAVLDDLDHVNAGSNNEDIAHDETDNLQLDDVIPNESGMTEPALTIIPEPATYASRLSEFLASFFQEEFGDDADSMLAVSQLTRKQTWDALNSKNQHFFTVIRALITRLNATVAFLNAGHSDLDSVVSEYDFYMLRSNIVNALQDLQKSAEFAAGLRNQMDGVIERSKEKERVEERRLSMMELSNADSENQISIGRQDLLEYISHQQFMKKKLLNRHLKAIGVARVEHARQLTFITAIKPDADNGALIRSEVVNAYNEQRITELEEQLRELNVSPVPDQQRILNQAEPSTDRGRRLMGYMKSLEESRQQHESELSRANDHIDRLENTVHHLQTTVRRQIYGDMASMKSVPETFDKISDEKQVMDEDNAGDTDPDLCMRLNDALTALDIARFDLDRERRMRVQLQDQIQQLAGHLPHPDGLIQASAYSPPAVAFGDVQDALQPNQNLSSRRRHISSVSKSPLISTESGPIAAAESRAPNENMLETLPLILADRSADLSNEHSVLPTQRPALLTQRPPEKPTTIPHKNDPGAITTDKQQDALMQTDPVARSLIEAHEANGSRGAMAVNTDQGRLVGSCSGIIAVNARKGSKETGTQTEPAPRLPPSRPHHNGAQSDHTRDAAHSPPSVLEQRVNPVSGVRDENDAAEISTFEPGASTQESVGKQHDDGRSASSNHTNPDPRLLHNSVPVHAKVAAKSGRESSTTSRYRHLLRSYFTAICQIAVLKRKLSRKDRAQVPPNQPSPQVQRQVSSGRTAPLLRSISSTATAELDVEFPPPTSNAPFSSEIGNGLASAIISEEVFADSKHVRTLSSSVMAAIAQDLSRTNTLLDETMFLETTGLARPTTSESAGSDTIDEQFSIDLDFAIHHNIDPSTAGGAAVSSDNKAGHRGHVNAATNDDDDSAQKNDSNTLSQFGQGRLKMDWKDAANGRRKRVSAPVVPQATGTGSGATSDIKQVRRVLDEREKELETAWKQIEKLESLNRALEENVADLQAQLRGERAPQVLIDLRSDNVRLRKEKAALLSENQDLCDQIANSLENEGDKVASLISDSSLADQELKKRISKMERMLQWWRQRWERTKKAKFTDDGDMGAGAPGPVSSPTSDPACPSTVASPIQSSQAGVKKPLLAVVNPVIPDPKSLRSRNVVNKFALVWPPNTRLDASATPAPAPKLKVFLKRLQQTSSVSASNSPNNLPDFQLNIFPGGNLLGENGPERILSSRVSKLQPANPARINSLTK